MIPTVENAIHRMGRDIEKRRNAELIRKMSWMTETPEGRASTHYCIQVTDIYGGSTFYVSILPSGSTRYTCKDNAPGVIHHVRMECERIVRVVDNHNLTMAAGSTYVDGDRSGIIVHPFTPGK